MQWPVMSKKAIEIVKFVGWFLLAIFLFVSCLLIYFSWASGKCQQTSAARQFLLSKLPPEQARTLRSIATESDEGSECSMSFVFLNDGKEIEVDGLSDEIHGTKFSSSDGGKTAYFLNHGAREK